MLIAEQDTQQVKVLKEYTESEFKEVEIVGNFDNGITALNYVVKEKVDILVLAINLEGISGFEVARRIREANRQIHIVMISAYDYADFLMEAMSFGVEDYLLKPLNLSVYASVITKMLERLDGMRLIQSKKYEREKREDQMSIFADYSFIYTFLWNSGSAYLMKFYQELLGIDKYGYILNMEVERCGEACVIDVDKDFGIFNQGIKDILAESVTCIVGPKIGKRIIIYVSQGEEQAGRQDNSIAAVALANKLRLEMNRCFDVEVRVGIGNVRKLEEVHDSYEESIKSLRYMENYNVIHIKDVQTNCVSHKNYIELENKFLQNAKFGREECMEQFGVIMEMIQQLSIKDAKNKVIELLVMLCHEIRVQVESEVNNLDYMEFMRQIEGLGWRELRSWAYTKVEYVIKSIRVSRGARKSVAVQEALGYINDHYGDDLTLDIIAKYVGVTPQHFSKIFKEETKYKYIEWVRKVRIEKAKEHLMEGTMNISQISDAVGFHDPNYFSRIFKRFVGKSPTEYANPDGDSNSVSSSL